jgi:hypothetical protein
MSANQLSLKSKILKNCVGVEISPFEVVKNIVERGR